MRQYVNEALAGPAVLTLGLLATADDTRPPLRRRGVPVLLAAAIAALSAPLSHAESGDLDATFGSGGTVTTSFDDPSTRNTETAEGWGVAIQRDGKIVVVGNAQRCPPLSGCSRLDVALARYHTDGTLDTSFGDCADSGCMSRTGTVTTDAGNKTARDVAIQEDGKILVAEGTVARYSRDGKLDTDPATGFGPCSLPLPASLCSEKTGRATSVVTAADVTIQPDGKIVAVGRTDGNLFAVARFTLEGLPDRTFGSDGIATSAITSDRYQSANAVLIQPDNKILAAGEDGYDFVLARWNPDGTPDAEFGSGGQTRTDIRNVSTESARGLALQGRRIIAAGDTPWDFALVGYDARGQLDKSFGSGGKVTTDFDGATDVAHDVAVQANGRIVAVGFTSGSFFHFALARYTRSGGLDRSFGSGGTVRTPPVSVFPGFGRAHDVAIQPDGKIVAAGVSSHLEFAVARYLP